MSIYKTIYLAGGCFWGMQGYFDKIKYIKETTVGYANSNTKNPSYNQVCSSITDAVETIKIIYDKRFISLKEILIRYLKVIDPFSIDRQGNDIGRQYRTGIYYEDLEDENTIQKFIKIINKVYNKNTAIEYMKLKNFYKAEEYHQKYLKKNPNGYCHINLSLAEKMLIDKSSYNIDKNKLEKLNSLQYQVTQNDATEPPFKNKYNQHFEKGIYVDIVSGEPLFLSTDKFECSCGWPAFSKPIFHDSVIYEKDKNSNIDKIQVKSKIASSHLGHVFDDGPKELTTLRYCINSASLDFIAYDDMKNSKYESLMFLFDF